MNPIEFSELVDKPNTIVGNVRRQIEQGKATGMRNYYGLRIPYLPFSSDNKIFLQKSRRPDAGEHLGQFVLPALTLRQIDHRLHYQKIIGEHMRDNVLVVKGRSSFSIEPVGVVREFALTDGERTVGEITSLPAILCFDALADNIAIKYRYQERYGQTTWFEQDEARDILETQRNDPDKSKAVDESFILFTMVANRFEETHGTHSRTV